MPSILQDLRYAVRQLRHAPGFTFTAILTLALGIGVNAAMFTLTYAILLKSLPVPEPGRLIRYTFKEGESEYGIPGPVYDALRKHQSASTDLLAWGKSVVVLTLDETPQQTNVVFMSGNGFSVLGLKPFLGRVFSEADDVTGCGLNGCQAVLNYDFWMTHLHGDRSVVGRSLTLNGHSVTIIGVLPRGFDGLEAGDKVNLFLPLPFIDVLYGQKHPVRNDPNVLLLNGIIGRLRQGQSLKSARANLQAILPQVCGEVYPNATSESFCHSMAVGVEGVSGGNPRLKLAYSQPLFLVETLSSLLLLLCCANIGLLILSRVGGRLHEFALRSALGASDGRIVRQIMIEVLLLVPPSLVGGIAMAVGLVRSMATMAGHVGAPASLDVTLNSTIVLFSCGIAFVTALLAGLWPALRMRRVDPSVDLKRGSYAISGKMTGGWIIPVQVAISATLLVPALLLGSTFAHLYLEPSGFQGQNLLFADVELYAAKLSPQQSAQAGSTALAELQHAPGIKSAAAMLVPPLRGMVWVDPVYSFDRHGAEHFDRGAWPESVSSRYFETMGTRILEGRALAAADETGEKVCVLSRSAAEFFFPGEDALGRMVYEADLHSAKETHSADPKNARRVVGIADDAYFISLRNQPDHVIYTPEIKDLLGSGYYTLVVRSSNISSGAASIRDVFQKTVPAAPVPVIYTYKELLNDQLQKERMLIGLSSSFAGIALVLVAVGLFGVLMRTVTQRTREIGIRIALGEQRASVIRMILLSILKRVCIGILAGSILAYTCARLLRSLLYETSISSPWIYGASGLILFAVAVCAALVPARRAASVDPILALRVE